MTLRAWPRVTTALLALIPVVMLVFIVATVVVRAAPVVTGACSTDPQELSQRPCHEVGIGELLSTSFSYNRINRTGDFGLLPAAYGSVELLVISMMLAVPASLAIALLAAELAPPAFARLLRLAIGLMSGIPPIVYALMAVVFVAPFILPKFTAGLDRGNIDSTKVGIAPQNWPPAGVPWPQFPWDPSGQNNTVLLAGIVLALLAIPFMAPLIDDAIRNVSADAKEASLALGASAWFTIVHVTVPQALAGIISAIRLGALKVLGDLMIGLYVVGTVATAIPNPAWDVLERTAPLSAFGAGILRPGGLAGCEPSECAVGYASGVALLMLAGVVVVITLVAERVARARVAV